VHYYPKVIFIYLTSFHIYFLTHPSGFVHLAAVTKTAFIFHATIFFYNRYEIVAALRGLVNESNPRYIIRAPDANDNGRTVRDTNVYDSNNVNAVTDNTDNININSNRYRYSYERMEEEQIGMSLSGPNSRAPSPSFNIYQGNANDIIINNATATGGDNNNNYSSSSSNSNINAMTNTNTNVTVPSYTPSSSGNDTRQSLASAMGGIYDDNDDDYEEDNNSTTPVPRFGGMVADFGQQQYSESSNGVRRRGGH
jgi:hypothetical protein